MSSNLGASPLRVRVESRGGSVFVAPVGEIDIDTAPQVDARLDQIRIAGCKELVLDLSDTTFIDSTGLHLALAWHERARRERFTFALVEGPPAVRRVIDLTGVRAVLNFVE